VADVPEIANITVEEDENLQTATISWDVLN
jgi:hypothetical protein